ncbi:ATP-binding protein [Desulfosporosinus sp. FKB]|uniref:sensor histidine kinase n=1 Tax=Desulfosporosinus sp. FKB TaxID=1969835 RepID=UPI001482216B|nr:ATP-binding protein [Desulfosporosinus sp. FKB]
MRITLLSGTILLLSSAILTLGASYNAHTQFNNINITMGGTLTAVPSKVLSKAEVYPSLSATAESMITKPALTAARQQFDTTNILILAVVSVLGMVMVYIIAGRSLHPIHELSRTISAISEDNLRQRIPEDQRNDEVGMLSGSFNIMLDRLEKSFLRQKRFSANVAHELKTPLATINAGIQVLHLDKNPSVSEYEETLATTERNVKRLMAVVDDLMALYDENEKLETVPINLQGMFESILSELRPLFDDKQIKTELQCGLKTVFYGNHILLYRACFNLVENAAKYNKGCGKILIETKADNKVGQIIITDTGNGIPADELEQIFEPFYRVNKSRSRKEGGAGLGLSIVKTIIEKHGWEISVHSTLGHGSVFTISLCL